MKRHEFDPVSFVFGMAFVALGLRLVLSDDALIRDEWLWPGFLLVCGAALVFVAARRATRRTSVEEDQDASGGASLD